MRKFVAIALFLLLILAVNVHVARAHDAIPTAAQPLGWAYGYDCCSVQDCFVLADGAVTPTKNGWSVNTKETAPVTIPYNDARIRESQDGDFHICLMQSSLVRCLYVPPFGL